MQGNDFPAIDVDEVHPYRSIRELYLCEEPRLLAAIRNNDRKAAVYVINLVLVHIYSLQNESPDLLKSLLLELVVMMSRAAVEAGVPQEEVLGLRFRHLTALASLSDDEELAWWLRESVDRVFDLVKIHAANPAPPPVHISKALDVIKSEACSGLTRDVLAKRVGVSPAHLTVLLREKTGRSFSELCREARIEEACRLLRETDRQIADIADACGFYDQSHFTRAFQAVRKTTPRAYRAQLKLNY